MDWFSDSVQSYIGRGEVRDVINPLTPSATYIYVLSLP